MNTSRKGSLIERQAISILRGRGYHVWRTVRSGYLGGANDLFGCDLIAIKNGERIRGVQVCTDSTSWAEKIREFEKYPWPPEHVRLEVWRWRGRDPEGLTRAEWAEWQIFDVKTTDDGWDESFEEPWPPAVSQTDVAVVLEKANPESVVKDIVVKPIHPVDCPNCDSGCECDHTNCKQEVADRGA